MVNFKHVIAGWEGTLTRFARYQFNYINRSLEVIWKKVVLENSRNSHEIICTEASLKQKCSLQQRYLQPVASLKSDSDTDVFLLI